jgi:class 3 adenylate cyclase
VTAAGPPPDALTIEEVASRVGASAERIGELVALGLLRPEGGTLSRADVLRARVVEELQAKGIDARDVAAAYAAGELTLGYLETAGRRPPRADRTHAELAEDVGIADETLERVYVAFGLSVPTPDELVRAEDLEALRLLPVLVGAGVGEGDLLRLARIWGDAARRVAQFQSHFVHTTLEEPFRRRGLGDNEAFEATIREVLLRLARSSEELLGWLLRRHADTFLKEHQFDHVETALERAGVRMRPVGGVHASVFADLTGYTSLTERAGDETAARVSITLAQLVREVAARHRGDVVKMLGDGVHFHFADPGDAVRASLEIVETVEPEGLPPAHVGVNAGPMIYDEGDWFGGTVNVAARIASHAGAHEVLVGQGAADAVAQEGFRLVEPRTLELKGISRPVTAYEAVRDDGVAVPS